MAEPQQPPLYVPGDRVYIRKIDVEKTVLKAYAYGCEWAYKLIDDAGRKDRGWREDEIERKT